MNDKYYALPKVRTLRGRLRRKLIWMKRVYRLDGVQAFVIFFDNNDSNILKTWRYKGRIRVNNIIPVELKRIR